MSAREKIKTVDTQKNSLDEFTERMEEVRVATEGDGVVEAQITDLIPDLEEGTITVAYQLPNGTVESEEMQEPDIDSVEYKFVNLCRSVGATIDTADELLIGSTITVERLEDGDWFIQDPRSTFERTRDRFKVGHITNPLAHRTVDKPYDIPAGIDVLLTASLFPFIVIKGLSTMMNGFQEKSGLEYNSVGVLSGLLGTILWIITPVLVYLHFFV